VSHVRIVEEVPGVPRDEAYFLAGVGLPQYPNHLHFARASEAIAWCEANGHTHAVEPFEP
jgi:hypothetical protein